LDPLPPIEDELPPIIKCSDSETSSDESDDDEKNPMKNPFA
jgi:hypothetical protein